MVVSLSHLKQLLKHEELAWREARFARKEVGSYFQTLRQALGLEANDVAKSVHISTKSILKLERGNAWSEITVRRLTDYYTFRAEEIRKLSTP